MHTYKYTYEHTYKYTHMHTETYTRTHAHIQTNTQEHIHKHTHTRFLYPFVMKQTFRLLIFLGNCKKNVSVSKAAKMCPWDTNVLSFRHMPRSGFILNSLRRSRIVFRGGYSTVYLQQYFSKVACPYSPTFVALRAAFCLWHLMCMLFSAWVLWCIMIFHPLGFIF